MAANGILLIDKDEQFTSHDVVAKARRSFGLRKIGHAGTLDPMATGLLVLGVGVSTRLLTHLVGLDKTYTATIRFGVSTVSDDREGTILDIAEPGKVEALAEDSGRIASEVAKLTGEILQTPSKVSAIKVGGRRAYDLVREGQEVELKQRPVTVHSFSVGPARLASADGVNGGSMPVTVLDIDAEIECSSGTYIRALARDLGEALGVGAHLDALRRTRVGPFDVTNAMSIEQLSSGEDLSEHLLTPAAVAEQLFDVVHLTEQQSIDLGHGKHIELDCEDASIVAALSPERILIGLISVHKGRSKVLTNFPVESEVSTHG